MNRAASICVRNFVSRKRPIQAINSLWGSKTLSKRSPQFKISKNFSNPSKLFFSTHSKILKEQTKDTEHESGPDPEAVIQDVTRNNQKVARIGRSKYHLNILI